MHRPALLFVDNFFDDLVVHRRIADPCHFRRHFRPMKESLAITSKAGTCCGPLRIIIGCGGISLDQLAGAILEKTPEPPPPFNPRRNG